MSYWKECFKIRDLSFPRFVGGPLDGVTDSPFRRLVREYSKKELLYTEMRHVAFVANDPDGQKTMRFNPIEKPLNYQVTAASTDFVERACEKITNANVDCADLNIGCPAKTVIKSGAGSAMMSDPKNLEKVLKLFRENLKIPFTVKMRAGFKNKNALEVAKLCEACGVDAIAIHPRLQTQGFAGELDYELVREIKNSISIPVLYSGGVVSWETAKSTYERTGADGFLIGRGLWARPWKLKELRTQSTGGEYFIGNAEILQCALKHLEYMLDYYGRQGLFCFRKHLPFYTKGIPEASMARRNLVISRSVAEVQRGLIELLS